MAFVSFVIPSPLAPYLRTSHTLAANIGAESATKVAAVRHTLTRFVILHSPKPIRRSLGEHSTLLVEPLSTYRCERCGPSICPSPVLCSEAENLSCMSFRRPRMMPHIFGNRFSWEISHEAAVSFGPRTLRGGSLAASFGLRIR